MNKSTYLIGTYGILAAGFAFMFVAATNPSLADVAAPVLWAMILIPAIIALTFVYRMWASIQDGQTRTSPVAAVGLLFVPFFNLYWLFRVYPGFVDEYNQFKARNGMAGNDLGKGLHMTFAILTIVSVVPLIGWFAALGNAVIWGIVVWKTCNAVNSLGPSGDHAIEASPLPPAPDASEPPAQAA